MVESPDWALSGAPLLCLVLKYTNRTVSVPVIGAAQGVREAWLQICSLKLGTLLLFQA